MKKSNAESPVKDVNNGKLSRALHVVANIFGVLLIMILLPVVCINLTLIIKSYTRQDQVPTVFGVAPLIVQSGSMEPFIMVDDLIFTKEIDPSEIKNQDVIAFQPMGETTVVTHRVIGIDQDEDGKRLFITKGDYNNAADEERVQQRQVVGVYFYRLEGAGKVAMFLQQPVGMVLFVAIPLALFLLYDQLRRFFFRRKNKASEEAEKEELERLRALAASIEASEEPLPEAPEDIPADPGPQDGADNQ